MEVSLIKPTFGLGEVMRSRELTPGDHIFLFSLQFSLSHNTLTPAKHYFPNNHGNKRLHALRSVPSHARNEHKTRFTGFSRKMRHYLPKQFTKTAVWMVNCVGVLKKKSYNANIRALHSFRRRRK